jgi:hypothetical protein
MLVGQTRQEGTGQLDKLKHNKYVVAKFTFL